MFDIDAEKLALVGLAALVFIGPKDLPRAMRVVGRWVGQARRMANHFRSGLDEMIRQSELEEMEQKWAEENARILREHPQEPAPSVIGDDVMRPLPAPDEVPGPSVEGGATAAVGVLPPDAPPRLPPGDAAEPEQPSLPLDTAPARGPAATA